VGVVQRCPFIPGTVEKIRQTSLPRTGNKNIIIVELARSVGIRDSKLIAKKNSEV
jgi:hypothetical protein